MRKDRIELFRQIAGLIPKQCTCDIVASLRLVSNKWKITFINGSLVFTIDESPDFVIPLSTIYGILRTSDSLYVLCNNNVLHQFDREAHQHWVAFLDDTARSSPFWMLN